MWFQFRELSIGSITNPLIDIFLYSHHLSAWYCIDIVRRNSVLITHGVKGLETAWQSPTNKWFRKVPHCNLIDKSWQLYFTKEKINIWNTQSDCTPVFPTIFLKAFHFTNNIYTSIEIDKACPSQNTHRILHPSPPPQEKKNCNPFNQGHLPLSPKWL